MNHLQDRLFGVASDSSPYDNLQQRRLKMQRGAGAGLALSSWEPATGSVASQWPLQIAQQQYERQQQQQIQVQHQMQLQQIKLQQHQQQQHQPPSASAFPLPGFMSFGGGPVPVNYGRNPLSAPTGSPYDTPGYPGGKMPYPPISSPQFVNRLPGPELGGRQGSRKFLPDSAMPNPYAYPGSAYPAGLPPQPPGPLAPALSPFASVDVPLLPKRARVVAAPSGDHMVNMGGGMAPAADALDHFRQSSEGQRLQTSYDSQFNPRNTARQQLQQMRPAGMIMAKSSGPF